MDDDFGDVSFDAIGGANGHQNGQETLPNNSDILGSNAVWNYESQSGHGPSSITGQLHTEFLPDTDFSSFQHGATTGRTALHPPKDGNMSSTLDEAAASHPLASG